MMFRQIGYGQFRSAFRNLLIKPIIGYRLGQLDRLFGRGCSPLL